MLPNGSQQKPAMASTSQHQTAEANLRLAADTMERTGWTIARLIAASVELGVGSGERTDLGSAGPEVEAKTSANRAAEVMRKSKHTIKAYLAAWNSAAEDGLCKPSADLSPEDGQAAELPEADWDGYYTNTKQRGVGIGQVRDRMRNDENYASEVASNLPPAVTEQVVRNAIKSNPETRRAARQVLNEVHTEPAKSNNFAEREALADERQEADRKQRGGARYLIADGLLVVAKKKIREAANEVHEANLTDEHRDLLRERVSEIVKLAQVLRAEVDGTGSVDWDAELATLMGGE